MSGALFAQSRQVSGTVTNESGEPITGAAVSVQGTNAFAVTDSDGNYVVSAPANGTIVVSFIGMGDATVAIGNRAVVDIRMADDAKLIDDVLVVAYGTTRREAMTGAATQIGAEKLEKLQVSNISRALEGVAPGVQVSNQSGQPGENATIRVRGIGSINANADPLYVVDGVPFGGSISAINAINTADVASITVLKDAASTALYGARAANGVIMITTKKGNSYRPQVTFEARVGLNTRGVSEYDIMKDPGEYMTTYWGVLKNTLEGGGQAASENLIPRLGYNPYNTANNLVVDANGKLTSAGLKYRDDWAKEAIRTGKRQEYNMTVSGGTDKSTHFLSAGYLKDDGIIRNSDFKRYSFRASGDYNVNKFIRLNGNLSYARGEQNSQNTSSLSNYTNVFMFTQYVAPIYPVYGYDESGKQVFDENGKPVYDFGDGVFGARAWGSNQNPVATNDANQNQRLRDNVSARFGAEVKFLKDFKFAANLGYDLVNEQRNTYQTADFGDAAAYRGRGYKYRTREQTMTVNQLLTYNKDVNKHTFDVLAGHESYELIYDQVYGNKTGFFDSKIPQFDNAINIEGLQSWAKEYSIESYFGRFNYDYDDKYYFSASFRGDASSRFAKDKRWGAFWSVGGSWRISKENFMSNVGWVDNLSLRASYGSVGNDDIYYPNSTTSNYYTDRTQYSVSNSDGAFAISKYYQGNPNLTWETSYNTNVGVSASLWDNLIDLDVEYFYKKTVDMLYNVPQPPSSGISYISENALTMNNKGVELTLGVNIPMPKDFSWSWTFTGTRYRNEVTGVPENKREAGITHRTFYNIREGRSVYDFYYYKYAGVDETGNATWYMDETDASSGKTTTKPTANYAQATKYYIGSAVPDFMGGITTDFAWKGIDLSVSMNYQIGGDAMDVMYSTMMHAGDRVGANWHRDILNAWTPDNKNTDIPVMNGAQTASGLSDRFLIKASYFSLRNITLGYTFPSRWLSKAGITSTRIYFAADNVALFSKRKGMDPRQYIYGQADTNYSTVRTTSLGLSLNF